MNEQRHPLSWLLGAQVWRRCMFGVGISKIANESIFGDIAHLVEILSLYTWTRYDTGGALAAAGSWHQIQAEGGGRLRFPFHLLPTSMADGLGGRSAPLYPTIPQQYNTVSQVPRGASLLSHDPA
ncbi:hypothetical protein AB1N83_009440 [Pleurotus pulmonarius]